MIELRNLLKEVRQAEHLQDGRKKTVPLRVLSISDIMRMRKAEGRSMNGVDETWLRLQLQAILDGRASYLGPYDGVDGCWKDEPCFLVGGSRGLKHAIDQGFKFSMLKGFHSIGVNHVVEDYHDFEWFLFQDKRFLTISKYNLMKEYKGRIFAHVRTRLAPSERVTIFYTQDDGPVERIVQGLFTFIASGFTAINLALVSGANPIYLLGVDTGGMKNDSTPAHYKDDYPGEVLNCAYWGKYLNITPKRAMRYAPWAERFVNVDPLGAITMFKKMPVRDIPELAGRFK